MDGRDIPGSEWERLANPTLKLVEWLAGQDGLSVGMADGLREAIEGLSRRGALKLPEVRGK